MPLSFVLGLEVSTVQHHYDGAVEVKQINHVFSQIYVYLMIVF